MYPTFVLAATLACAALCAPAHADEERRAAAGFDSIHLKGSVDLVVRRAASEGLTVRAESHVLPLIETRVDPASRVLHIGVRPGENIRTSERMTVTVDAVQLRAASSEGSGDMLLQGIEAPSLKISLSGSGDAKIEGLQASELSVRIAGSGDVAASGSAPRLSITIAGSGDVRATELASDDVSVGIAGSGDVRVNAARTLGVNIAGSGDVTYSGDATVRKTVMGSGKVIRR